jgi:hypothetical protein
MGMPLFPSLAMFLREADVPHAFSRRFGGNCFLKGFSDARVRCTPNS